MGLFASNKDIDESMLLALADKLSDKILSNWGVQTPAEPNAQTPAEPNAQTPAEPNAQTPAEPNAQTPAEPNAQTTKNDDILKKIDALTKIVTKQSPVYSNLGDIPETFEDILHQQSYYPKKEVTK